MYILARVLAIILLILIAIFLHRILWKNNRSFSKPKNPKSADKNYLEEMKKDPICGTYVPESQAIAYQFQNQTYFFCSEVCKRAFQKTQPPPPA